MYVCYYARAHADLLTCVTHVATRYARGRLLCSDLHIPMESTGPGQRESERERESHEEEKGREEDEKKGAFAQHLPDYSFRRPGGFTDGERLRQRKNQRRSDRDEENGAP